MKPFGPDRKLRQKPRQPPGPIPARRQEWPNGAAVLTCCRSGVILQAWGGNWRTRSAFSNPHPPVVRSTTLTLAGAAPVRIHTLSIRSGPLLMLISLNGDRTADAKVAAKAWLRARDRLGLS